MATKQNTNRNAEWNCYGLEVGFSELIKKGVRATAIV